MNNRDTADARRFRYSLAASVAVNGGLLLLAGWLDHMAPIRQPLGRPHLKMVLFSVTPSPLSSARQGVATAAHLASPHRRTAAARHAEAVQLPSARHPSLPHSRAVRKETPRNARPRPALRVVTIQNSSAHLSVPPEMRTPQPLPLFIRRPETAPIPAVAAQGESVQPALNVNQVAKPVTPVRSAKQTAQPKPAAASAEPRTPEPMPTVHTPKAMPSLHTTAREASRGVRAASGAGWTGGAGADTSQRAGGPFGIGNGLAAGDGPRHIVYVLDISGSMGSRIARADEELETALRELRPDETFNIVAFSGGSQLFDPDMADVTPGMVQKASVFLHGLEIGGDTNLEGAVTRALMLRDVNEVVVLTDGVPTVGETNFSALARLIRQLNLRHARICTIGLVGRNADGTDNSFEAATLLQEIARDSGGTSKLVPLGVASR